ncbi:hypothetical protein BX600DRAFT_517337 [Xylariales sp. PMI_506]|nr:hypothetical protein BX600DRAFT_517337 [Xylariales sp. PMI_506]
MSGAFLITTLSRAGMTYRRHLVVTNRAARDKVILRNFKAYNIVSPTATTRQKVRACRFAVQAALEMVFVIASTDEALIKEFIDPLGGILDFLPSLKERIDWASGLTESTFIELFHSLVKARLAWHSDPQEPYNFDDHCGLALRIDDFLNMAGHRWDSAEAAIQFYEVAGGFDESEDILEEEDNHEYCEDSEGDREPEDEKNDNDGDINLCDLGNVLDDYLDEDEICEGVEQMDLDS